MYQQDFSHPQSLPQHWAHPEAPKFQRPTVQFQGAQSDEQLPHQHTQQPIVTGTSVLAVVYKDGVMMCADTLASYGSLARFRDERRLFSVNSQCLIGGSGDMADFHHVQHQLRRLMIENECTQDEHEYRAPHIYEYLSRMMYGRRQKMNPLWNSFLVGGIDPKTGEKFLGCVDLYGTTWQAPSLATGFGAYIAQPLLRAALEKHQKHDGNKNHPHAQMDTELSEQEAKKLLEECMRVLYYRDARSLNRFQIAKCTKDGVEISEPYSLTTEWAFAEGIRGYGQTVDSL